MTWLVWTKVLPPLLTGHPPTYWSIVKGEANERHVAWALYWDDRLVGTASSTMTRADDGMVQMCSHVDFTALSLDKISPIRIGALGDFLGNPSRGIPMQATARFEIDPLGRLLIFESSLATSLLPEPIRVLGTVEGSQLRVTVRAGEFVYKTNAYLAPERPLGDTLTPQTRLPGLRIGQNWTEPIYNPFQPPNQPMEILQATVEREDFLFWDSHTQRALLVVYRPDAGTARSGQSAGVRGRVWVRRDGTVLQQEVRLMNSWLRFVRQPDPDATEPRSHGIKRRGDASPALARPRGPGARSTDPSARFGDTIGTVTEELAPR